jgi:cell division septum initiation protein DivIVA
MNGDEKPAEVAKLLDEIAAAVPQLSEEEHFNQLRELHNRLEQKLKEGRQSTTLADLNDQLSSIDEHLAHVNDNTSELCLLGPAARLTARPTERLFHLIFEIPWWKGRGAVSEEMHEPASDIDTVAADSLKVLDPNVWTRRALQEKAVRLG